MSKSESIRTLAREGLAVADIARRVGVRYQFARNVLLAAGLLKARTSSRSKRSSQQAMKPERPALVTGYLVLAGFEHSSRWLLSPEGALTLDRPLPKAPGVYCMVQSDRALYVGLATMGLEKRFRFYIRPGKTQRTSQRVHGLLKSVLRSGPQIDIYTASPPNMQWNGLPISGLAGLELGLIESFYLPWNIRGVRP